MTAATQTQAEDAAPTIENAREVAATLVANMTAAEIRRWMSEHDLKRSRAARKMESALQAYEQDPELTERKAEAVETEAPRFHVVCGHCDNLDEEHDDADEAVEAAKAHKSENPTHFPRAVDTEEEENIYG